jgi:hypothetical protein
MDDILLSREFDEMCAWLTQQTAGLTTAADDSRPPRIKETPGRPKFP